MIQYRSIQFTTTQPDTASLLGFGADTVKKRLPNPRPLVSSLLERVPRVVEDVVDGESEFQRIEDSLRARLRVAGINPRDEIAVFGLPERLLGHTQPVAANRYETTDVEGSA